MAYRPKSNPQISLRPQDLVVLFRLSLENGPPQAGQERLPDLMVKLELLAGLQARPRTSVPWTKDSDTAQISRQQTVRTFDLKDVHDGF